MDNPVVSVFGANDGCDGEDRYETARAAGRKLAELGYTVANGGYGGTMEASARGARDAGGRTIGVVCSIWDSAPNAFIDEIVRTESLSQRVETLIELGSAGWVVLPGATGTLVELGNVWEGMCKGWLDERPLVCVTRFWDPLIEMMRSMRPRSGEVIGTAETSEDLEKFFAGRDAA